MSPALVPLLLVAVLAAGCGDDDGSSPDPEGTTTTEEVEETTTSIDPFTVPDEITVEYVEAVLTELERINGDALRLAMAEGMSPEVSSLLLSIYTEDLAAPTVTAFNQQAVAGFPGVVSSPGDVTIDVTDLTVGSLTCLSVEAVLSYDDVLEAPTDAETAIELRRQSSNDTGWVYAQFTSSGDEQHCDV